MRKEGKETLSIEARLREAGEIQRDGKFSTSLLHLSAQRSFPFHGVVEQQGSFV